jgi:enoyl-CoA hydratase
VSAPAEFSSPVLRLEPGAVATLWLDRPGQRNAMGEDLWRDLPRAVACLEGDDQVRAVVLAAAGPHFSVGLDLKAMSGLTAASSARGTASGGGRAPSMAARARAARAEILRIQGAIDAVGRCAKPVIAAVHGYCIGGGIDLIAACDIRLASADAVFSVREAKVAIVADLGSLQRLPRIISAGHLAELAYTGKDIDAERARQIGLVNDVYADRAAVVAAALALGAEMAANSPLAVQGTKAVLAANDGRTVAEGLEYVATWNAAMLSSDDLAEAMAAFLEKRPGRFGGT